MKNLIKLLNVSAIIALFFMSIIPRKGVKNMQDLYVGLVIAHRRTCNPENKRVRQVPSMWRDAVLEDLKALGYDADGNIAKTEE
mgnify:FL=1